MSYKVKCQNLHIEFVPGDIETTVKNFVSAYYNLNHPTATIYRQKCTVAHRVIRARMK